MNILFKRIAAVTGVLAAGSFVASAHAQTTAELRITGTITPPACTITLGGNGTADFGNIGHHQLKANGTKLNERTVDLKVACEGPARVGLNIVDNRASSKIVKADADAAEWASSAPAIGDAYIFGLGTATSTDNQQVKIGGAMFGFKGGVVTVDGTTNSQVIYSSNKTTWANDATARQFMSPAQTYSFLRGSTGALTPVAITNVEGTLSVVSTINKTSLLPSGQQIKLDGSATISLVYL